MRACSLQVKKHSWKHHTSPEQSDCCHSPCRPWTKSDTRQTVRPQIKCVCFHQGCSKIQNRQSTSGSNVRACVMNICLAQSVTFKRVRSKERHQSGSVSPLQMLRQHIETLPEVSQCTFCAERQRQRCELVVREVQDSQVLELVNCRHQKAQQHTTA